MNAKSERCAEIAIGDFRYQIASDDEYLSALGTEFEPQTTALFGTLVKPRAVVLDIGANIGCTSILFSQRARRVLSFEPSPTTFHYLERNIRNAGIRNVELHNVALGSEPGSSSLTFAPSNRAGGFVSDKTTASAGHVTESITIRRLDDVVESRNVDAADFIKIDVEGFEQSVLTGGRNAIQRFQPIVALELNHWCLNALHRICVPDFLDFLCAMFPMLVAVEGATYLDVRDPAERYIVMYHHINHFRYTNLVAAFSRDQLADFSLQYRHSS